MENYGGKREKLKADEERCLNILPEVVWNLILEKLSRKTNSDHVHNCVNSSPYFRQLVHTQKVLILFPKVINVLAFHFEEKEYVSLPMSVSKMDEETAYSKPWRNTVLNCRLVCSSWNKAVEHLYQSPRMTGIPEYLPDNLNPLKSRLTAIKSIPWTRQCYNIWDIETCEKMLTHFEQSHYSTGSLQKCQFLGRSIILQVNLYGSSGEQRQHYFNLISQLLKFYGGYILYCDIWVSSFCFGSSTELYMKLREWLYRMPNLKCLRILDQGDGIVSRISERKVISRKPFPVFKNLEILEVKYLSSQIVNELVRRNGHVSVLKLHQIDDKTVEENLTIGETSQFANLKEFSVISSVSGSKMMEEFGHLWKLEKVHLENIPIKTEELFKCILCHNWGDTLKDLFLGNPFSGKNPDTVFDQSRNLKLAGLPNLKSLKLDIGESYFLDFILPLNKSLEYLEIKMLNPQRYPGIYRDKVREEQTIELVGFEENMQMSNIWNHFEQLKLIVVEYTSYPYTTTVYLREGRKMVFLERFRWEINQS